MSLAKKKWPALAWPPIISDPTISVTNMLSMCSKFCIASPREVKVTWVLVFAG